MFANNCVNPEKHGLVPLQTQIDITIGGFLWTFEADEIVKINNRIQSRNNGLFTSCSGILLFDLALIAHYSAKPLFTMFTFKKQELLKELFYSGGSLVISVKVHHRSMSVLLNLTFYCKWKERTDKVKFTSAKGGRDSPYRLHKVGSPCRPRSIYWDANEGNWADCMKSRPFIPVGLKTYIIPLWLDLKVKVKVYFKSNIFT